MRYFRWFDWRKICADFSRMAWNFSQCCFASNRLPVHLQSDSFDYYVSTSGIAFDLPALPEVIHFIGWHLTIVFRATHERSWNVSDGRVVLLVLLGRRSFLSDGVDLEAALCGLSLYISRSRSTKLKNCRAKISALAFDWRKQMWHCLRLIRSHDCHQSTVTPAWVAIEAYIFSHFFD